MSEARHQIICEFPSFAKASEFRDTQWVTIKRVIEDIQRIHSILMEGPTICCFTKPEDQKKIRLQIQATIAKLRDELPKEKTLVRKLLKGKAAEELIRNINRLGGIAPMDPVAARLGTNVALWDVVGTYHGEGIGRGLEAILKALPRSPSLPSGFKVLLIDSNGSDPHEYPNKPQVKYLFKSNR